jgi:hypothetical protein
MIPEAPVLFSIAGISASLAGLAGLVAGLRRGADVRPMDLFRLREIVEFAFANVLLALSTIPIALAVGSEGDAYRIVAVGALAYLLVHIVVLYGRSRRNALPTSRGWVVGAVAVNIAVLVLGIATLATGSLGAFEGLLLALLARPMLAFLLVLASFETQ